MRMVALLRGINVGGNRKVPMAELRVLATDAGFTEVETYINSGNLVFDSGKTSAKQAEAWLESAIAEHFGFAVDVIVRTAVQWKKYASGSPFPDAAMERPNILHLGLAKLPCASNTAAILSEGAKENELIEVVRDAIWIDFGDGIGKTKMTPALFDKAAGSPVTMRNWRSVLKIDEMLNA